MWVKKAFRRLGEAIKDIFLTRLGGLTIGAGITTVLLLFIVRVDSLSLDLGEILAILGIWLMIGVLLGQNKASGDSQSQREYRLGIKLAFSYLLFFIIVLIYVVKADDTTPQVSTWEVIGLIMISLTGLIIGFFIGQDRDDKEGS